MESRFKTILKDAQAISNPNNSTSNPELRGSIIKLFYMGHNRKNKVGVQVKLIVISYYLGVKY